MEYLLYFSAINNEVSRRVVVYCVISFYSLFVLLVLIFVMRLIAKTYLRNNKDRIIQSDVSLFRKIENNSNKIVDSMSNFRAVAHSLGLNKTIDCSYSIVSNAANDPIKYIIKYSDISLSLDCIEQLEYMENLTHIYESLETMWANVGRVYRAKMPLLLRIFISKKNVAKILCDNAQVKKCFSSPYLFFSYVSPAGRSRHDYRIVFNSHLFKHVVNELSGRINKKRHASRQRSAMTADLREAIKQRDNYTCQLCGNSVLKEPNLLLEVDHIIPIAEGGETIPENLQTLCWRCNRAKGAKK